MKEQKFPNFLVLNISLVLNNNKIEYLTIRFKPYPNYCKTLTSFGSYTEAQKFLGLPEFSP